MSLQDCNSTTFDLKLKWKLLRLVCRSFRLKPEKAPWRGHRCTAVLICFVFVVPFVCRRYPEGEALFLTVPWHERVQIYVSVEEYI